MSAFRLIALCLLIAAVSSLANGLAAGRALWVSPQGNDDAAGTAVAPWRTLKHALARLQAGDTLTIRGGVYREGMLQVVNEGTPEEPILVSGAPGEQVVVKGSQVVTGWKPTGEGSWYVENWSINSQQLFLNGRPLEQVGATSVLHQTEVNGKALLSSRGEDESDLFPGSFYFSESRQRLYVMLPDRSDPNNFFMEASVQSRLLHGHDSRYVTVRRIVFEHCNGTSRWLFNSMVATGLSHWTFEDCTFRHGDFAGVGIGGVGHTLRRCEMRYNGVMGVNYNGKRPGDYPSGSIERQDFLMEGCTVSENNYRRIRDGWGAAGIKAIPNGRGLVIRNSRFANNYGHGVWIDACRGEIMIEGNIVSGNQDGIRIEITHPMAEDAFGVHIIGNQVYRNQRAGIEIAQSESVVVEHNTVLLNGNNALRIYDQRRSDEAARLGDVEVTRNILGQPHQTSAPNENLVTYPELTDPDSIRSDRNFFITESSSHPGVEWSGRFRMVRNPGNPVWEDIPSLAEIRSRFGFERFSATGDPRFLDPDAGDFSLRAGSPATGYGADSE